jgi:hypothetical protein
VQKKHRHVAANAWEDVLQLNAFDPGGGDAVPFREDTERMSERPVFSSKSNSQTRVLIS